MVNIQIIGTKALAHRAYGPKDVNGKDVFADVLESELTARGYTTEFLAMAGDYTDQQGGVHCASNLIPNLQASSTPWWKK